MKIVQQLKHSRFSLPFIAVVALVLLAISEVSYHQALQSLTQLDRMSEARQKNLTMLRYIVDAETGQRGYLITKRVDYLKPYHLALQRIRQTLDELDAYYGDHTDSRQTFTELKGLVSNKLSELDTTLVQHDAGQSDAWLQLMLSDIGKEQMESIRVASERMNDLENQRIAREYTEIADTLGLSRIGIGAMTTLSVLALVMYLRQSAAMNRQQRQQQRLVQDERDRLEEQVRERTAQLTDLTRHLQTAREDERSRLARDLHDELGALLTAAKLDAARLKSRLGDMSPEAAARLTHLNETLNSGIALKRRIIEDLRPSSLSNLGLVAALDIQTREFADRSGLDVQAELEAVKLSPSAELTVYRFVQEALTNIAKHAKAGTVRIRLRPLGAMAEISVHDDGVGFDTQARRTSAHGLLGMSFRVEADGGDMHLTSRLGEGTEVTAVLPQQLDASAAPSA